MLLVGIAGQKYNGKDTIADYLVSKYGFIKLSFGSKLKELCKIVFGFTEEQLYGSKKESYDEFWNITPREIYQYLGTDIFRKDIQKIIPNIDETFWVKCVEKEINQIIKINPNAKIVISDVRFINEVSMIKSLNGIIIRVIRPNNIHIDLHESEQQIPFLNVDHEIINDQSLDELYKKIDDIYINL
jgi:dephospho-CoA kinase